MKKEYKILILIMLNFMFYVALWGVDIGASAYMMGACVQNPFFECADPNLVYHSNLYFSMLLFLVLSFFYIKEVVGKNMKAICYFCKQEFDPEKEDSIFWNGNFWHLNCWKMRDVE